MVRALSLNGQILGALALVGTFTAFGCMVDDSADTPAETGGTAGAGGSGTGGSVATGGGAGMPSCMPNPTALTCAGTKAPAWGDPPGMAAGVLIDWTTYTADKKWGNSASGQLTGGTSLYHGPSDVDMAVAADGSSVHLTGTITSMGYVGVVFWFGPCIDASAFTGINFSIGGTLGGAVMKAQIQTHEDYPVDVANSKGGCSFTDCDAKFSECAGPTYQLVVPAAPEPLDLPWSMFTGGMPTAAVTPNGLVGLQYQLECQADAACTFDIMLGSVGLTIAPVAN